MPNILTVEATQMNLVQLLNELANDVIDGVRVMDGSDYVKGGTTYEATELGVLVKESVYASKAWLFDGITAEDEISVAQFASEQNPIDRSDLYAFVHMLRDIASRSPGGSAFASLLVDSPNADGDVTYTSKIPGAGSNATTIKHTDPGAPSQTLSISVTESSTGVIIEVSLATDGGSAIISTAAEVSAIVNGDATASKYVTATPEGTGGGVVVQVNSTLAGGSSLEAQATLEFDSTPANSDLYFTAAAYGKIGNRYSTELLDPGDINQSLTFTQVGDKLSVSLATDAGGTITTSAGDITGNWPTGWDSLVTVAHEGTGAGIVEAHAETNLSGGSEHPDKAKYVPLTLTYKKDQLDVIYDKIVFVSKNQNTAFALV